MEFQELVEKSKHLEVTYHVTPEIYYSFQRISNDYNPLHTDVAFAERKGFPDRVMYGNILNGFISHFVGMALPSRDVMIQTQDVQFRKPVFLGDSLTLKTEIETMSEAVEVINYKLKFYRETAAGGGKPLLIATGHVQIGMLHDKEEKL